MIEKEGSMTIKFSIREISKVLFSLRYLIKNYTLHPNEDRLWISSYSKLVSDIEGMLKTYEESESAERKKESSEGSRATETSS
jgi:hypothetical protein